MNCIVQDDVLVSPDMYRFSALSATYVTHQGFDGIAPADHPMFDEWLRQCGLSPKLSFWRKSPLGQQEPNYIHHDAMMGEWTAILFLNPEPHPGDGTIFWESNIGSRGAVEPDEPVPNAFDLTKWRERFRVMAQFNRAVIFPSHWYHSRALFENYGEGDRARLVQVVFGTVSH